MKPLLDALILSVVFIYNTAFLGLDWQYVAIAVGGSFSGAVILAYFRRDDRKAEQVFKTLCASISGIIVGAAIEEWFQMHSAKMVLIMFFLSGLLSLVMLRTLLGLTERNAAEICKDVLQRLLNLKLPDERERQKRRRGLGE